jgi:hypothetical protein
MELNELQNRLTNIIAGISNTEPKIPQSITQSFIKYYTPDQTWVISITDIEGIEQTTIEYYTWDEKKDGPIPVLYPIAKRINPQTKNPYMNQNI